MPLRLVFWSVAAAVIVLAAVRLVSRPERLRLARRRLHGLLLEMWLYGDEPAQAARTQFALLGANLRYLWLLLPAVVASSLPVFFIWTHLDRTVGRRPLSAGETAVVTATLSNPGALLQPIPNLALPGSYLVETPPVRIPAANQVAWRVRAITGGGWLHVAAPPYSSVEVHHPRRVISLLGLEWPWQVWFLLFFSLAALALMRFFGSPL